MAVDYSSYGTPRLELGQALHEYMVSQDTFIGTKLFTLTPVAKKAANYPVVTRESLTQRAGTARVARSAYNRTGIKTEDYSFTCVEHGLEGMLDASEIALYASDFDAEMETTKDILHKLLREQEIRVATAAFNTSTFTGASLFTTPTYGWDNVANSTPINDVAAAKAKIFANCGMEPNTLTISYGTLQNLLQNAQIVGRIQYAQVASPMMVLNMLANMMGVQTILVGGGVYNAKPEGATAFAGTNIWSDSYALLSVTAPSGSVIAPSVGRTFLWTGDSPENVMVESYEEPQTRSTVYRVRQNTEEKLIDANFGHLLDIASGS
jgi:hypothetical protein